MNDQQTLGFIIHKNEHTKGRKTMLKSALAAIGLVVVAKAIFIYCCEFEHLKREKAAHGANHSSL